LRDVSNAESVSAILAEKLLRIGLVQRPSAESAKKDSPYEGSKGVKPLAYFIVYIAAEGKR
jgi:hypothetical protein